MNLRLGSTCFRTEWRDSTNFRRLLLRDSPSSQPPSLPKFNFKPELGSASPTVYHLQCTMQESRFWHTSCTLLSVLKSHFNPASITVLKQLLSKSEKRFVGTHWVQEGLGLSEVLCVRPVLFIGKSEFRFRRFNKGSRALATRAKTHCLDQNRQSLGYIAHRSNH